MRQRSKFGAVAVLSLQTMLSGIRLGSRRRAASGVGAMVLVAALSCYLSSVYSFAFAEQLSQAGMLSVLFLLLPVMSVAMGVFFTLLAAQGLIFGGKDNDLMLALPIPPFQLLFARTLSVWLENLIISVLVLLPAGVAYQTHGGGGGMWFWFALTTGAVLLSLVPTLIALVCGYILAWLTSKMVRRALLSALLYTVFSLLLMVGVFQMNGLLIHLEQSAAALQRGFSGWGLPFLLLEGAVCGGRPLDLAVLALLCILPFLAVVWVLARRYQQILSRLSVRGCRRSYRLGHLCARGVYRALLRKEAGRFFSTPIYLFNTGFGLLLILGAGIAALYFRLRLAALTELLEAAGVTPMPVMAAALAFLVATVAITASSISLEGKNLWILQAAPVTPGQIFAVKILFQLLLVLPCITVCAVCLTIALGMALWEGALLLACAGAFACFCAPFGLAANLLVPRLDAPNDTVVVKQSAASLLGTFGPILVTGGGVGVYLLLATVLGGAGALAVCTLLLFAAAGALWILLERWGSRRFRTLSGCCVSDGGTG